MDRATASLPSLPQTPYRDATDPNPCSISLLRNQQSFLRWMDRHPWPEFNARAARNFIWGISDREWQHQPHRTQSQSLPPYPQPREAVRMIYYMRQFGYDVHVRIDAFRSIIWFMMVDHSAMGQGRHGCFLMQSYRTGAIYDEEQVMQVVQEASRTSNYPCPLVYPYHNPNLGRVPHGVEIFGWPAEVDVQMRRFLREDSSSDEGETVGHEGMEREWTF